MATIAEFYARIEGLSTDRLMEECVAETEHELIKVNQEQLLSGKDADGNDMPDYKDQSRGGYGEMKLGMNPRNEGRYDYKLTGDTFNRMEAGIFNGRVIIEAAGTHGEEWDKIRGINSFGVYESDYLVKYRQESLYPEIIRRLKQMLKI